MILQVGDADRHLVRRSLLLVADSVLGSMLLKSQGRQVWRRFNEATAAGRIPHSEIIDGVADHLRRRASCITPGFLTDIFGLFFLIPPTRALFRRTRAAHDRARDRLGARRRSGGTCRARAPGGAAAAARGRLRRGHRDRGGHGNPAARAVSEPAISLGFFDPAREVHGIAALGRGGAVRGRARADAGGPRQASSPTARAASRALRRRRRARPSARSPARPTSAAASRTRLPGRRPGCGPAGRRASGRSSETHEPPAWADLDARARSSRRCSTRGTRCSRPRGARAGRVGHGEELVNGALVSRRRAARGRGRADLDRLRRRGAPAQRRGSSCGCPGEDFPRRASGSVRAGSSLALEGLRVHAARVRLADGGPRRRGLVRDHRPRDGGRAPRDHTPSSRDFGGVLTSPLIAVASSPTRRRPASTFRPVRRGDGADPRERDGAHPLYELESGRDHRGGVLRPDRGRARRGRELRRASRRATSRTCTPTSR